ncbi:recombination regulator RecX [Bacillus sp. JCM 19034]|uniref:recombination regulator RecX n=1 Tax=Bacillus sp. JCM 19034 TaxID=1481928 RepID=UPI000786794F|nr:recombination regulator RecX [Bacillus sp. JCM 19034]
MVSITKIEVQKNNKSRYSIFINRGQGEEYGFSIDEDILIKFRLHKGQQIDEQELLELIEADEERKVYHLAVHYLSFRMRSKKEIREYLLKKDKLEKYIDIAIRKLEEEKLLNDQEFARAYIQTKLLTQTKGPLKLKQELKEKGVNESIIHAQLAEIPLEHWIEKCKKWVEKKGNHSSRLSRRAKKDKLIGQLYAKGFSDTMISEALKGEQGIEKGDDEWEAICYQGEKIKRKYRHLKGWEFKQKCKQALYRKGFTLDLIDQFLEE